MITKSPEQAVTVALVTFSFLWIYKGLYEQCHWWISSRRHFSTTNEEHAAGVWRVSG